MKNKLFGIETVWACDFCGKEFKTKKESDKHELVCKKNPKNNEIVFKIKKPNSSTIFGWASLFIFIYFIVYVVANANAQNNGLPIRDLLKPQEWFTPENEIVVPTITPTSIPTIIPTSIPTKKVVDTDPVIDCKFDSGECKGASMKVRNSQCSKVTCCQIGNSWVPYLTSEKCREAQNKEQPTQINNQPATNNIPTTYNYQYVKPTPYPPCTVNYSAGPVTYNGYSPDQCVRLQATVISPNIQTTPVPTASKSQADIDKCKSEIKEKYTNLINGCYVQYQGSASDACARGYQNLSSSEMSACY